MEYEIKDINGNKIKLYYSFTTDFMRVNVNINGESTRVILPINTHRDLSKILNSILEFSGYNPDSEIRRKRIDHIYEFISIGFV